MNDSSEAFWFGLFVGLTVAFLATVIYSKQYASSCEKEFDVYQCEWKYLPVEKEASK